MSEISNIVAAIENCPEQTFLATVVDVVGSAYRRPTARMLILPDQTHIGSISGGCLERDLCRATPELVRNGPKLVSFDTRDDSTNFNPRYNLGCSGILYILVQQITRDESCPCNYLRDVVFRRKPQTIATLYQLDNFRSSLFTLGQQFYAPTQLTSSSHFRSIWEDVTESGEPVCCELSSASGAARLLIEKINPPHQFWIFGAGDDAIPLAKMARQLNWEVTICDQRAAFLTRDRFPGCQLRCQPWTEFCVAPLPQEQFHALLMTHDFHADQLLLPTVLEAEPKYVGILGPKSRTRKLLKQLFLEQTFPEQAKVDLLNTPVGLDLGAKTPAEIGVAILAEIIAKGNRRSGGALRQRQEPIHDPVRHEIVELDNVTRANCEPKCQHE